jgi:hypothetical protein
MAIVLEYYYNGSFYHMTTTIGVYLWQRAPIVRFSEVNTFSD